MSYIQTYMYNINWGLTNNANNHCGTIYIVLLRADYKRAIYAVYAAIPWGFSNHP